MILVDSSVWIDFFHGCDSRPTDMLARLLRRRVLLTGDLILAEVLQGFRRNRDMEAARQAALTAGRHAMPGGWRSRWAFEVVTTRDPLVVLAPHLPGAPPAVSVGWIEVTDDGEVHAPLRSHVRRRIRLLGSERIDGR